MVLGIMVKALMEKGGLMSRTEDRSEEKPGPFQLVGSPIEGLVDLATFDQALTTEMEAALVEAAGIADDEMVIVRRSVRRRVWFLATVRSIVRSWLANDAHRPARRAVANELIQLQRRLHDALSHHDPQLIKQVADAFEQLSSDAGAEISRHGFIDVPALATLRAGDWQALQRLYGLIPVTPAPASGSGRHSFARDARFRGNGAGELNRFGRPTESRLELLAIQLAVAYEQATGRLAGRGAPFDHFFALLLTVLFNTDTESERGGRALRRAIRWHKTIGRGRRKRGRQPG
jgi:hypothetical protein